MIKDLSSLTRAEAKTRLIGEENTRKILWVILGITLFTTLVIVGLSLATKQYIFGAIWGGLALVGAPILIVAILRANSNIRALQMYIDTLNRK